jgi:hypothetical protein
MKAFNSSEDDVGTGRAESKLADSQVLLFWLDGVESDLPVFRERTKGPKIACS